MRRLQKHTVALRRNSDSHIKATLVASSQTVWIESGRLRLGRWQAIFFCEFDGPAIAKCTSKSSPIPPLEVVPQIPAEAKM
jgi:secondary thiamine-phosphate synthase enzyme